MVIRMTEEEVKKLDEKFEKMSRECAKSLTGTGSVPIKKRKPSKTKPAKKKRK